MKNNLNLVLEKDIIEFQNSSPEMAENFNLPIIELIRKYQPELFDGFERVFSIEFDSLLQKLNRAEQIGKSKIDRLNAEISEWNEILEDEVKSRILNVGNYAINSLLGDMANFLTIMDYSKGEVEEDQYKSLIQDFSSLIESLTSDNFISNPSLLSESERALSEDQFNKLPILKQIQLQLKVLGLSDLTFELLLNTTKEIVKTYFQADYFNKLINYRDIISEENPIKELNSSIKSITIGLPKLKERIANDGITSLSRTQTAILVKMLRKNKVFFRDESFQTKENIYKAIQVLTGYGKQGIKEDMYLQEYEDSDKVVVQKLINSLSKLNINDL